MPINLRPYNREEQYLSNLAGNHTDVPVKPYTRKEMYLNAIVNRTDGMDEDILELRRKVAAMATDMKYQGSVEDYAHLPADAKKGDVYTTADDGKEYVFDGTEWIQISGGGADVDPAALIEMLQGKNGINVGLNEAGDKVEIGPKAELAYKEYVDNADEALDAKIKELELFKFPNLTIIGTPTIQSGQVSDFTTSDYLEFPFLVDFRNQPFEINFAFTTGTDVTTQQNILDSEYGLAFAIRNSRLVLAISYDGATWAFESVGTLEIAPDTTYRVKITWNRLVYTVSYSTDGGETYTQDISHASAGQPYPKQMYIGAGKLATNAFGGSVNLNFANLLVNGEVVWTGMDDAGLASRLATDLSNVDAAGEAKIKEIAGGGIKKLTSADYDYPTYGPGGVAIWKLEDGIYDTTKANIYASTGANSSGVLLVKRTVGSYCYSYIWCKADYGGKLYQVVKCNASNGQYQDEYFLHTPIDNLTTASSSYALSAKQGKVLNEKIDAAVGNIETLMTALISGGGAQ